VVACTRAGTVTAAALLLLAGTGALIGTVGLGGFLVVPIVLHFEGTPVREAVAVAAVIFLASGLTSLVVSWRTADLPLANYRSYFLAAAPGALGGALLAGTVPEWTLTVVIASAFGCAGVLEWLGMPRAIHGESLSTVRAVVSGAITGVGSALTGTSGPMVAMPLLAWSGVPVHRRIRLAQVVQLPIAITATAVFVSLGDVPWALAGLSTLAVCLGQLAGTRYSASLQDRDLRRFAALLMLAASGSLVVPMLRGSAW
jgi:uncharacterized membrane protein YfcA